ncbi:MAG TPA: hypothetical protein VD886_16755, partial [Herpetosiphonaceae bacterium]|nr:hypothetical protein [Herpetosiphonaceae bacterium]
MDRRTVRRVHRSVFLMLLISMFFPCLPRATAASQPGTPQSVLAQLQNRGGGAPFRSAAAGGSQSPSLDSAIRRAPLFERFGDIAMAMAARYDSAVKTHLTALEPAAAGQLTVRQNETIFLPLLLATERPADLTVAGGEVRSEDGSVVLTVPAGAVTEDVWVYLSLDGPYPPVSPDRRRGAMFTLSAFTRDRRPVTQFAQPLTLQLRHTAARWEEAPPALFFFDTAQGNWQALPTTIDQTSQVLRAITTHFTDFAVLAPDNYGVELLSTEGTADGTFIVTAVAQGISLDNVLLQVKDFSSGAVVEVEPNADDSLFYVPAGSVGGNIGFHFSTTWGALLPFVGYGSLGAYGYWATTGEGFQPPFVGQKSGSWPVFATLVAAYLRNGGAGVLGTADSELVHDWRGAPTQGFAGGNGHSGSVLMYNSNRCDAFQLKGDILDTYIHVSPEDWLGMPISDELTAPPDFYRHIGQPISYFEHGIITREPGGSFRDQNYYPLVGDVYASFTLIKPGELALEGSVTVRTMPVPGFPGTAGDFEVVGGESLNEFVALGNDTYRATIAGDIIAGQARSFEVRIRPRSGDGPEGTTNIITIE